MKKTYELYSPQERYFKRGVGGGRIYTKPRRHLHWLRPASVSNACDRHNLSRASILHRLPVVHCEWEMALGNSKVCVTVWPNGLIDTTLRKSLNDRFKSQRRITFKNHHVTRFVQRELFILFTAITCMAGPKVVHSNKQILSHKALQFS